MDALWVFLVGEVYGKRRPVAHGIRTDQSATAESEGGRNLP